MRTTVVGLSLALVALTLLSVGCQVEEDLQSPEVSISDATWSDDTVEIEVTTNLPDGAVLSWQVVEGDDLDPLDPVDVADVTVVADGAASVTADVSGFTDDQALVEVSFARLGDQPTELLQYYDVDQEASDEASVSR